MGKLNQGKYVHSAEKQVMSSMVFISSMISIQNYRHEWFVSVALNCWYASLYVTGACAHDVDSWHTKRLLNTLRPRQNGRNFPDDIFKCIFLNENVWISINILLKFVPKGSISNIPALVQIMAWRRLGDKPLYEPMLACSPTHICVSRPQWVNGVTEPFSI